MKDNNENQKKHSKKKIIIPVIVIIAILVVAIIGISALNSNRSKNSDSYTADTDYSYEDIESESEDESDQFDAFKFVENVYYDENDGISLVKYNKDYTVTSDGYTYSYTANERDGEYIKIEGQGYSSDSRTLEPDSSLYTSTGKIRVYFRDEERDYTPLNCSYQIDPDIISSNDIDEMLEIATSKITTEYPLANLEAVYYGYDEGGTGDQDVYQIEDGHYNEIKFVFSYVKNGQKGLKNVSFYDLKYTDDGEVIQGIKSIAPVVKTTISSISDVDEYEETQRESWRELTKIR